MPVANGTLLHKKNGAAIILPGRGGRFYNVDKIPLEKARRLASKEFPQPYPPMRAYPTAIGAWRRLPCEAITKGGFFLILAQSSGHLR